MVVFPPGGEEGGKEKGLLEKRGWEGTNNIASCELLFCAHDGAAALSGIEGGFAADNGFFLGASAVGFGADFGNGVPVVHDGKVVGSQFTMGLR